MQKTKFKSEKFKIMFSPRCIIFKDKRANSVDPDEVAHNEPPNLDLGCLQIQLFSLFGAISVKPCTVKLQRLEHLWDHEN